MKKLLFSICVFFCITTFAEEKIPLLGSIENNEYVSPDGTLRIPVPFDRKANPKNIIRDAVYARSLNVLFEDINTMVIHRVELGFPGSSIIDNAIESRVYQQQGLINRAYPGNAILIHFDKLGNGTHRYLFKQVAGKQVRFHYIQVKALGERLLLAWTDFSEAEDTPENEERIISGDHAAVITAQQLATGIKRKK